ncbi:hypothetical protein [Wenyingzhuangia sp. IMCC45574]
MKNILMVAIVAFGLTTVSCDKKDKKVIKVDAHGAIDKSKDALKDAGDFLKKKSKDAVDAVKEKTE